MARRGASTGDPCIYGRIFTYLNKPKVQKALHANTTHLPFHWDFCDGFETKLLSVSHLIRIFFLIG